MRRSRPSSSMFGSDSFLDVLANLVGVLIILIILVGLRVRQALPETFIPGDTSALGDSLEELRRQVQEMSEEREELRPRLEASYQRAVAEEQTLGSLRNQGQNLAVLSDELLAKVAEQNAELQQMTTQLTDERSHLALLRLQVEQLRDSVPEPTRLNLRNPLSLPAGSHEAHFEVRAGRIAFIDVPSLVDQAKGMSRQLEPELRRRGRATGVTERVGAFRLKFAMLREDMPFTESLLYGSGSFRARLVEWRLMAVASDRGEPVGRALLPDSQLRTVLALRPPDRYSVTLWTYPDSFAAFRRLRDRLYDEGYAVAARPVPAGTQIAGSVYGTRTRVQ